MNNAKILTLIIFTVFLISCSSSPDVMDTAIDQQKQLDKTHKEAVTKPQPDTSSKVKNTESTKPKPAETVKAKNTESSKPKPAETVKAKNTESSKPKPAETVKAKNTTTDQSNQDKLMIEIISKIKQASMEGNLQQLDPSKLCSAMPENTQYMCEQKVKMDIQSEMSKTTSNSYSQGNKNQHIKPDLNSKDPCSSVPKKAKAECEKGIADMQKENEASKAKAAAEDQAEAAKYAKNFDPANISKIAQFNFTELNNFSRMSKLRSGVGHDYSSWTSEHDPSGMSCRSMKHYFIPKGVPRENSLYSTTPHSFKWMTTKFFAPMDGTISKVQYDDTPDGREAQFSILSSEYPGYYISFLHIRLLPGLVVGSSVAAGQQIGTLGNEEAWGEIVTEVQLSRDSKVLLSFLQVATDEVLQLYKDRGIDSVEDVIITKEERDANPLECERKTAAGWFKGSSKYQENIQFSTWVFESEDNWFFFKN